MVVLALLLAALLAPGGAAGANAGECGQDTGRALVEEDQELNLLSPYGVGQVLCGEFFGPGSQAMIVPLLPPTCGGYLGWVAFSRLGDGSWQSVLREKNGQTNVVAIGADLEETVTILGRNDPRCTNAEKSTKTRIRHWNGKEFVAGPWTVHLETGASSFAAIGPRFALQCQIGDEPDVSYRGASCKSGKVVGRNVLTQSAEVRPSERVRICRKFGMRSCGGAPCGCYEDFVKVQVGERVTSGRFTCRVARGGVTCTSASGQGFFINPGKVRRVP